MTNKLLNRLRNQSQRDKGVSPDKVAGELPNAVGLLPGDYLGAASTLCGGCGHDSISAAISQAAYELSLRPDKVIKTSGIGCSSKTPGYFLGRSHGINAVHGRMPCVSTGINIADPGVSIIAVSGDGDSASIGLSHFMHCMRRNVNMLYICENNGVYGLTKGQFSASALESAVGKKGDLNPFKQIDLVALAMQLEAPFVARGFSGNKAQLINMIKMGISTPGFSFIDVISPCVTFNNHDGSMRDYASAHHKTTSHSLISDLVVAKKPIEAGESGLSGFKEVQFHDGSQYKIFFHRDHNLSDLKQCQSFYLSLDHQASIHTGVFYLADEKRPAFHDTMQVPSKGLRDLSGSEEHLNAFYKSLAG